MRRRAYSYIVVFGSGDGRDMIAHNLVQLARVLHKGVSLSKTLRHGKISFVFVGSEIKKARIRGQQFKVLVKSRGNYYHRLDSLLFSQYERKMAEKRAKRVTYLRDKEMKK